MTIGDEIYDWMKDLFPINRSLTGEGVRQTLTYLQNHIPEMRIQSVASGYQAFDWQVPQEWVLRDAYIADQQGNKIIDITASNLHVIGYSEPVKKSLKGEQLLANLHYLPDQPHAIPYLTSYYNRRWGFCVTKAQYDYFQSHSQDSFNVVIDSDFFDGVLNYGELIIPGDTDQEILLSTYICHPSMANNELSGPVVTTALAREIQSWKSRKFTYRILFVPETIGSIVYLSKHLHQLKQTVAGGYVVTCVGDDKNYSLLNSKDEKNLSERIALRVFQDQGLSFKQYPFTQRGSDERQYCSPGVDLPISSIMRSKYGEYDEYHTSLDNLDFVSPSGLQGAFDILLQCLKYFELNKVTSCNILCEPQLGKRGLYPQLSTKDTAKTVRMIMNLISYSDGTRSLLEICEYLNYNFIEANDIVSELIAKGVLDEKAV